MSEDKVEEKVKAPAKVEEGDFLVLSCQTEIITTGLKMTVKKVATSEESAIKHIKILTGSMPEFVLVVKMQKFYSRKPQFVVEEIK